jgi:hypothetical protein
MCIVLLSLNLVVRTSIQLRYLSPAVDVFVAVNCYRRFYISSTGNPSDYDLFKFCRILDLFAFASALITHVCVCVCVCLCEFHV